MLASNGRTPYCILTQPEATAAERHAAAELARYLERITGAAFPVRPFTDPPPACSIIVGPGKAAQPFVPAGNLETLGPDEVLIRCRDRRLLLAGGRPRGTLYAVYRFLQQSCGCRWWTPWAETIPAQPTLAVPALDRREQPAFRWRDVNWFPAFDRDWAARNQVNGTMVRADADTGGQLHYAGFVHTFFTLVPPEEHFRKHPEWFSLLNGKRTPTRSQLCLTNPQLRQFVVRRIKEVIREHPEADVVSLSQNDCAGNCQCASCRALDQEQGSPAGSLLDFVNHVAREVRQDHPRVLIDTLAYAYSRKPPRTLQAEPNVAVRVCSIECDFGVPLDQPRNAKYASDLQEWRKHCSNLFVWDYTTNFTNYLLPHPNWFVLGPNLRFFHKHGVVSVFTQGTAPANGGELPELRSWLLARLLWDPQQDDSALIDEFLAGYYGQQAAPFIREYLDLMRRSLGDNPLRCSNRPERAPFLTFAVLQQAEQFWQKALDATREDPEKSFCVEQGQLSVRTAFLVRWAALRRQCQAAGADWPLSESRRAVAEEWLRVATRKGPAGWSPLEALEEYPGRIDPAEFARRLSAEPGETASAPSIILLRAAAILAGPSVWLAPLLPLAWLGPLAH